MIKNELLQYFGVIEPIFWMFYNILGINITIPGWLSHDKKPPFLTVKATFLYYQMNQTNYPISFY